MPLGDAQRPLLQWQRLACARGRVGGRWPKKLTSDQAAFVQQLYDALEKTVQQIADLFGVPRSGVYRHLDREKTGPTN
ncbi:hypothetical protein [Streptomyces sp. NPDC005336]|uniref:hypothetical protein n=1 Tax=Streptomyces sp. NPDC005336 TaxID=3157035 RepID=UPI0033B3B59C